MSRDVLVELQRVHAFDPHPLRVDLDAYHVPFDALTGTKTTEAELGRAVRVPERAAVVGPIGGGKSSVIAYALGPLEEGLAPIRIPVEAERDEVIASPAEFAAHIVRTVANHAAEAALLTDDQRRDLLLASADRIKLVARRSGRISVAPHWMVAGLEVSAELRSQSAPVEVARSASEIIHQARRIVNLVRAHELLPILVIDDSDHWLNVPGLPDRSPLIAAFFSKVVRMLAEELNVGVVMAVHERYREMEAYRGAAGFIETTVEIPRLEGPEPIARIVEHRVRVHTGAPLSDVMGPGALDELARYYSRHVDRDLRKVMLIAHTALQAACADGTELISYGFVEAAIAEWAPD